MWPPKQRLLSAPRLSGSNRLALAAASCVNPTDAAGWANRNTATLLFTPLKLTQ
jgi:hypothetical protein